MAKKRLAIITMLLPDRQALSLRVQKVLTVHGHIIKARLGLNISPLCRRHCPGWVILALEGEAGAIRQLADALSKLAGTKIKLTYSD